MAEALDGWLLGSESFLAKVKRLMEKRVVRFVQVFHGGWDHHSTLPPQKLYLAYEHTTPRTTDGSIDIIRD